MVHIIWGSQPSVQRSQRTEADLERDETRICSAVGRIVEDQQLVQRPLFTLLFFSETKPNQEGVTCTTDTWYEHDYSRRKARDTTFIMLGCCYGDKDYEKTVSVVMTLHLS